MGNLAKVNLNRCIIKVSDEKEYNEIAGLLDNTGVCWTNRKRYSDWSPYHDMKYEPNVEPDKAIYLVPRVGCWLTEEKYADGFGGVGLLTVGLRFLKKMDLINK